MIKRPLTSPKITDILIIKTRGTFIDDQKTNPPNNHTLPQMSI